jgi:hypothetical protein
MEKISHRKRYAKRFCCKKLASHYARIITLFNKLSELKAKSGISNEVFSLRRAGKRKLKREQIFCILAPADLHQTFSISMTNDDDLYIYFKFSAFKNQFGALQC